MTDMPYFMENDEWYEFNKNKMRYVLTDKAPKKARDSYEVFYKSVYGGKNQKEMQVKNK